MYRVSMRWPSVRLLMQVRVVLRIIGFGITSWMNTRLWDDQKMHCVLGVFNGLWWIGVKWMLENWLGRSCFVQWKGGVMLWVKAIWRSWECFCIRFKSDWNLPTCSTELKYWNVDWETKVGIRVFQSCTCVSEAGEDGSSTEVITRSRNCWRSVGGKDERVVSSVEISFVSYLARTVVSYK